MVVDASFGGAGLKVDLGLLLPSRFHLVLAAVAIPVLLIWREGERVGVRFAPEWRPNERERHKLGRFVG